MSGCNGTGCGRAMMCALYHHHKETGCNKFRTMKSKGRKRLNVVCPDIMCSGFERVKSEE